MVRWCLVSWDATPKLGAGQGTGKVGAASQVFAIPGLGSLRI